MRGESSPPTARVLAVVELLVRAAEAPLRFVDVSRELDMNQATVHAILTTLCDKGWATRDPVDKTFSVGPELAAIAARTDVARPVANAARTTAAELSDQTGYPASVIERTGDWLVMTAFEDGAAQYPTGITGDRIPFAPPFGVALAAWDAPDEQHAWIERAPTADAWVHQRLEQVLARTRERGFDIDRMTPALAQTARAIQALSSAEIPDHVHTTMEQLRGEFTTIGYYADDSPDRRTQPVATISAPVLSQRRGIALMIGVHPMRVLTSRQVNTIGHHVAKSTAALSRRFDGGVA